MKGDVEKREIRELRYAPGDKTDLERRVREYQEFLDAKRAGKLPPYYGRLNGPREWR